MQWSMTTSPSNCVKHIFCWVSMLCPHTTGKKIVAGCTQVLPFGARIFFFQNAPQSCQFWRGLYNARITTDLNLHLLPNPPTTEQQELEMLNRTRIWIVCFSIDKSAAVQFGKPSTLREDQCVTFFHRLPCLLAKFSWTSIVCKSHEWYKSSNFNHPVGHFPFESLHGF
jgi:hypothetical protein